METAPRIDTSRSGNSRAASSEAEYTEAPASETMILVIFRAGYFLISSAASLSVSRLAVPLPMAISSTECLAHRAASTAMVWSHWFFGTCG
ncbi:hypothetical protein D3C78_1093600 [compost metagenome]